MFVSLPTMNELMKDLTIGMLNAVREAINTNKVMCILVTDQEQAKLYDTGADSYWADMAGFENAVYADAESGDYIRGVFVAPVISPADDILLIRPNDRDLSEGEFEHLFGIAFDFTTGVDVISLPVSRRPSGEAVFGEIDWLPPDNEIQLEDGMPGFKLYRKMLTPTG